MRPVLLVAHGQPSDPAPAAADLARLAGQVALLLPGRAVGSATLAEAGAVAGETARLGPAGVVYPMFMAGGWFTRVQIPARLAEAGAMVGAAGWQVLEPLGCDPALHDLAVDILREAGVSEASVREVGGAGRVLLAAHGSFKTPVPSDVARHAARHIAQALGVGVAAAFIDQEPQLSGATDYGTDALCLPFFAASGGHVTDDIPAALARAGFRGRLLPAIGTDHRVPALIARAVIAGQPICQTVCRYKS